MNSNVYSPVVRMGRIASLASFAVLFNLMLVLRAQESSGDWRFTRNDGLATIREYVGTNSSVTIPDTLDGLPVTRIDGFNNLQTVVTNLVIPDGVVALGPDSLAGCDGLVRVTMPQGLVASALAACSGSGRLDPDTHLIYLVVNDEVAITGHDLWDMGGFGVPPPDPIYLEIPAQISGRPVRWIGQSACASMALSRVTIPASIVRIGDYAFGTCSRLLELNVEPSNPAFSSVDGVLFDKVGTALLQYPAGRVDGVIPEGVARISARAFAGSIVLEHVALPGSLLEIGDEAFADCPSLTSIAIPDGVATIPGGIFANCVGLAKVDVGRGVKQIADGAFDTREIQCGSFPCYGSFYYIGSGPGVYFRGDAPTSTSPFGDRSHSPFVLDDSTQPEVFYLPGSNGWTNTFGGIPTANWGRPLVEAQPMAATVYAGASISLSAGLFGAEPMYYQWQRNGHDLSGARNATLILTNLRTADVGSYQVVVSNLFGTVTSREAAINLRTPNIGSYEAAAVALGPMAFWALDETNRDAPVAEFVGDANGTYTGDAILAQPGATANTGTSADFDGVSWVDVASTPALDVGSGDFSVAAWIYPKYTVQSGIVAKGGYKWAHGWLFDFNAAGDGTLRLETSLGYSGGQGSVQTGPGVVVLNEWQHVAVSCHRDPGATAGTNTTGNGWTRIYRNGKLVQAGDIGLGNLNNRELPLTIGYVAGGDGGFPGGIDEVALFGRALSGQQIAELYTAGIGKLPPLQFARSSAGLTLTWTVGTLQSASTLGDDNTPPKWEDLPGATSPYTISMAHGTGFYRVLTP